MKLTDYDLSSLFNGFVMIVVATISNFAEFLRLFSSVPSAPSSYSRRIWAFLIGFFCCAVSIYVGGVVLGPRPELVSSLAALSFAGGLSTSQAFSSSIELAFMRWEWDFIPHVSAVVFVAIYIFSLGSSSFVEEEHQIVYFFYCTLLIISTVWTIRKQHLKSESSQLLILVGLTLASFSLARKWNQTGNKWLGFPDVALFISTAHPAVSQLLLLGAAAVLILLNHRWASSGTGRVSSSITILADLTATIVVLYKLDFLEPLAPKILSARFIFIVIASLVALSALKCDKISSKFCSRWRNVFLAFALLELFLLKQINASLVALITIQAVCLVTFISKSSIPTTVSTVLFFFAGRAAWFCLGNSNSLSSIDLASAYIGLDSYDPVNVGILLFLSSYAGPILFSLAQVVVMFEDRTTANARSFLQILPTIATIRCATLVVFCAIITMMRYHLFIWSVFSPKFFYECFHTMFTTAIYAIILPCYWILFQKEQKTKKS
jgi:ethanolamine phosphate transferase 2 subunit G